LASTYTLDNGATVEVRHPLAPLGLAIGTLGAVLIVPPLVSLYNTGERIRRVRERAKGGSTISPVLALLLLFIPLVKIFQTVYLQSALNAAWERAARVAALAAVAPTPPALATE
jgi:hypothetical protein